MAVGGEDESKKKSDRPTDLLKFNMKYGRLVVFIRHGSADIWGFRYGLTLVIGTLKLWPAPVFSCVWFVLSNTQLKFSPHDLARF